MTRTVIDRVFSTAGRPRPRSRRIAWLILTVFVIFTVILLIGRSSSEVFLSTDFEQNGLNGWVVRHDGPGASVEVSSEEAHSGEQSMQIRAAGTGGSYAYARSTLPSAQTQLTLSAWMRVADEGPRGGNTTLVRILDANRERALTLYRQNRNRDRVWIEYSGRYRQTSGALSLERWTRIELLVVAWGRNASTIELRIGGRTVYHTAIASIGPMMTVQFGNEQPNQPFGLAVDDVRLDLGTGDTSPPDTEIVGGPRGKTSTDRASFVLRASDPDSAFACKLDGGDWIGCASPRDYYSLAPGRHRLLVRATDPAGNTDPIPATRTWTVADAARPLVLVGAGDVASCESHGDETTARLLDATPGTVFTTGNVAYPDGSPEAFSRCYEESWGRHRKATRPAPGPRDLRHDGGSAYFETFGDAAGDPRQGYYSYDLGAWHVIVLNSNCAAAGGCELGSPQERWLRRDLAAHGSGCTLAYWHHPLYSSGRQGGAAAVRPFWEALYAAGAEVVLVGRDRFYERFDQQDADGRRDDRHGLRQFTVGTGGAALDQFGRHAPLSAVRENGAFGVLKLQLAPHRYSWEFLAEPGSSFSDAGTTRCHAAPVAPRPGEIRGSFQDGFESGDLSAWSSVHTGAGGTAVVQRGTFIEGRRALRLTTSAARDSYAFVRTAFTAPRRHLTLSGGFYVQAEGPRGSNVPLLRVFDDRGKRLVSVYRQNRSFDQLWVAFGRRRAKTAGVLPLGSWARLGLALDIGGPRSRLTLTSDGSPIFDTSEADLGDRGVLFFQIGNDTRRQPMDLVADAISAK